MENLKLNIAVLFSSCTTDDILTEPITEFKESQLKSKILKEPEIDIFATINDSFESLNYPLAIDLIDNYSNVVETKYIFEINSTIYNLSN